MVDRKSESDTLTEQSVTRDDAERFIEQHMSYARWEEGILMVTFESESLMRALVEDYLKKA